MTFIWLHNWHSMAPLYKLFWDRILANLGRSVYDKVSSIILILNGAWNWPRPRKRVIQQIQSTTHMTLIPQGYREDEIVWTISPTGHYSIG